jgi:hypothetical protein
MAKNKKSTKKKASETKATKEINKTQANAAKKKKDYYNSKDYKNAQKAQNMTIDDIGKKYGFDFSKDYANRQAETAAQGQRNVYNSQKRTNDSTNKTTMQRISNNYDSSANDLDKGYFQQFLGTRQSQANRGLNAGIAANQNLQLAMNKQGEVADLWKQRNMNEQEESMRYSNQNQTISEALAQIEKEKYANAENLYQNNLARGYDILSSDRSAANQWADSAWNRTTFDINNDMDFSKMRVADIYNEQQRADAAAARAAARRSYGGGGGGYSSQGGPSKTVLTPAKNDYDKQVQRQQKTPIEKYYSPPVPQRPDYLSNKYGYPFRSQPSVNNNQNLSAWEKNKMLGL